MLLEEWARRIALRARAARLRDPASGRPRRRCEGGYTFFFWESAEPAADLLVLAERPSLSLFEALDAAPLDVFLVFLLSRCDSAEPAADLLLEPVDLPPTALLAELAAFLEVVFPAMTFLHGYLRNVQDAVRFHLCSHY